jgi:hypothetical protein
MWVLFCIRIYYLVNPDPGILPNPEPGIFLKRIQVFCWIRIWIQAVAESQSSPNLDKDQDLFMKKFIIVNFCDLNPSYMFY